MLDRREHGWLEIDGLVDALGHQHSPISRTPHRVDQLSVGRMVLRNRDRLRGVHSSAVNRTCTWIPRLGFVESRLCGEGMPHQQLRDSLSPTHSYKCSFGMQ